VRGHYNSFSRERILLPDCERLVIFFWAGSCGVLQGILRKRVFLWWFFAGENVVECVVNVVF
jgi:hypothetical protein